MHASFRLENYMYFDRRLLSIACILSAASAKHFFTAIYFKLLVKLISCVHIFFFFYLTQVYQWANSICCTNTRNWMTMLK